MDNRRQEMLDKGLPVAYVDFYLKHIGHKTSWERIDGQSWLVCKQCVEGYPFTQN